MRSNEKRIEKRREEKRREEKRREEKRREEKRRVAPAVHSQALQNQRKLSNWTPDKERVALRANGSQNESPIESKVPPYPVRLVPADDGLATKQALEACEEAIHLAGLAGKGETRGEERRGEERRGQVLV